MEDDTPLEKQPKPMPEPDQPLKRTKKDRSPAQIAAFARAQSIRQEKAKDKLSAKLSGMSVGPSPTPPSPPPPPPPPPPVDDDDYIEETTVVRRRRAPIPKIVKAKPKKVIKHVIYQSDDESDDDDEVFVNKPSKTFMYV
jgi:hypothetical protein